jgi:tetratricopeptide (TPR) repeat protein
VQEAQSAIVSADQALIDAERLFAERRYWEMIGLIQGVLPVARGRTRLRLRVLRGRAWLLYADHRKDAIEEFEAVVAEDPDDARVHFLLGGAYRDQGLTKRAIGHFRKALELRPQFKEAQAELLKLDRPAEG